MTVNICYSGKRMPAEVWAARGTWAVTEGVNGCRFTLTHVPTGGSAGHADHVFPLVSLMNEMPETWQPTAMFGDPLAGLESVAAIIASEPSKAHKLFAGRCRLVVAHGYEEPGQLLASQIHPRVAFALSRRWQP